MSRIFFAVVCGLILTAGAGLVAQSGSVRMMPSGRFAPRFAEGWRPNAGIGSETRVIGSVIDIRQAPVAHVRVQLRSLINGTVQQANETDENGEYAFSVEEPGTYVVETVLLDGRVAALSNAGSLARYETLRTVVQLPGRWDAFQRAMAIPQNVTDFFGVSAQTSMTATTVAIAASSNLPPVNAGEPVSATSQSR